MPTELAKSLVLPDGMYPIGKSGHGFIERAVPAADDNAVKLCRRLRYPSDRVRLRLRHINGHLEACFDHDVNNVGKVGFDLALP